MHAAHKSGSDYCGSNPSHSDPIRESAVLLQPPCRGGLFFNDDLVQ
jgi:hypothetical protein